MIAQLPIPTVPIPGLPTGDPVGAGLGALADAAGWSMEKVFGGIVDAIGGAVKSLLPSIAGLIDAATAPQVTGEWFSGAASSPYQLVAAVSVVAIAIMVIGAVPGAAMKGDTGGMLKRLLVTVPIAIIGIATAPVWVKTGLDLADGLTEAFIQATDGSLDEMVNTLTKKAETAPGGELGAALLMILMLSFIAFGALVVWVVLLLRTSLLYLLVALIPAGCAAMLWESTRGFFKKLSEVVVVLVFSKPVLALALSVGAGAVNIGSGGKPVAVPTAEGAASAADSASSGILQASTLLPGGVVLLVAGLTPWILLKLLPGMEQAAAGAMMGRAAMGSASTGGAALKSAKEATAGIAGVGAAGAGVAAGAARKLGGSASGAASQSGSSAGSTPSAGDGSSSTSPPPSSSGTSVGPAPSSSSGPDVGGADSESAGVPPTAPTAGPPDVGAATGPGSVGGDGPDSSEPVDPAAGAAPPSDPSSDVGSSSSAGDASPASPPVPPPAGPDRSRSGKWRRSGALAAAASAGRAVGSVGGAAVAAGTDTGDIDPRVTPADEAVREREGQVPPPRRGRSPVGKGRRGSADPLRDMAAEAATREDPK